MPYGIKNQVIIGLGNDLFGAKPLPEPKLTYCQVDLKEHELVKGNNAVLKININQDIVGSILSDLTTHDKW